MTQDRWTSGAPEITAALRALYAAPADEPYWESLEARILARIACGDDGVTWWSALVEMARPGLLAAAGLVLAASLALVHSRQAEARSAYASVISPAPSTVEPSTRAASVGDGDVAIHFLVGH